MNWVRGIGDSAFYKVVDWFRRYETGRVFATRESEDMITKDKRTIITCRILEVGFRKPEVRFIRDILKEALSTSVIAIAFENILSEFESHGLVSGSVRVHKLALRKEEIHIIIQIMENCKAKRQLLHGIIKQAKKKTLEEEMAEGGKFYEDIE